MHKGSSKVNISAAIRLFRMKLIMKPCVKCVAPYCVQLREPNGNLNYSGVGVGLLYNATATCTSHAQYCKEWVCKISGCVRSVGVSDRWVCKISTTEAKVE